VKIYIPNIQEGKIGGGWSFTRNFLGLAKDYISTGPVSSIFFITGATLVKRHEVEDARASGKKIVLRIDGVPEDSRNRGTGWPRLKDYAELADVVVFQSEFIRDTVGRLLGRTGPIIYNGVNTTIFKNIKEERREDSILYVNYRKSEQNKRVEEAIERFRYWKIDHPEGFMQFVGLFSKVIRDWNFWMLDYKRGKDWDYHGVAHTPIELAQIMQGHEYIAFPSFADPCPNTLIEAMSCGCKPLWINDYGGQVEIVKKWDEIDWSRERMVSEYLDLMKGLL